MIADEFPEMGAISPQTLGGTYGALTVSVGIRPRPEQSIEGGGSSSG
jgi:hypothetical protein